MGSVLFKLLTVAAGGALVASTTDARSLVDGIVAGGKVVITCNDLEIARTVVRAQREYDGVWPSDLGAVLHKQVGGRKDPDKDRWGTSLRLAGVPKAPHLLSCGPDGKCGTDDDLKVWLEQVPAGEKEASLSDALQTQLLDRLGVKLSDLH